MSNPANRHSGEVEIDLNTPWCCSGTEPVAMATEGRAEEGRGRFWSLAVPREHLYLNSAPGPRCTFSILHMESPSNWPSQGNSDSGNALNT